MPTTKLVKLVYLIDYSYFEHYGETLTGFQYMWDHHGPNALSHAIKAEAELLAERGMVRILHKPNIYDTVTRESAPGSRLVFNALSPHWRGPEDDKDGQRQATHPYWIDRRLTGLAEPE